MKTTTAIIGWLVLFGMSSVHPLRAQEKFAELQSCCGLSKGPRTDLGSVADLKLNPGEIDRLGSLEAERLDELFREAVVNRNLGASRQLLELGASVDGRGDQRGYPLLRAVTNKSRAMVDLMLEYKADPNATHFGRVAIIEAARRNETEIVEALLKAGARPDGWDRRGMTALDYAVANQNQSMVTILQSALGYADPTQRQPN